MMIQHDLTVSKLGCVAHCRDGDTVDTAISAIMGMIFFDMFGMFWLCPKLWDAPVQQFRSDDASAPLSAGLQAI